MDKLYTSILEQTNRDIVVSEVDEGQPCLVCDDECPGFTLHPWRNRCLNCKCPREKHDVCYNTLDVRLRLGWHRQDSAEGQSPHNGQSSRPVGGYTWVPAGLQPDQVEDYMSQLPNNKVPREGTQGQRYRQRQLIRQLPRQDLSERYCRAMTDPEEVKDFRLFRELRDQVSMGIGDVVETAVDTTCQKCKGEMAKGNLVVTASKVGQSTVWHPACFTCNTCRELLVDLVYCHHQTRLYCERHFAQIVRPRCPACDEVTLMDSLYGSLSVSEWSC